MPTLLFVYAVDGGVLNAARDYLHKLLSPATYPCKLCALTSGSLGEDPVWSCAVKSLPLRARFLHRGEFLSRYPGVKAALPAVYLLREGAAPEPFLSAGEIERCADAAALAALVRGRLDRVLPK
jgi:hypothetical protein